MRGRSSRFGRYARSQGPLLPSIGAGPERRACAGVKQIEGRKSETDESIQRRLNRLEYEYAQADKFDHIIINDNLDHAIQQIEELILV